MDDPLFVHVVDRFEDLSYQMRGVLLRVRPLFDDAVEELAARDQLHDEINFELVLESFEQLHYVGMREPGARVGGVRPRLPGEFAEPAEHPDLVLERVLLALERLLVDDLDGEHGPGTVARFGQPHLGESARAQELLQHVLVLDGSVGGGDARASAPAACAPVAPRLFAGLAFAEQRHRNTLKPIPL